MFVQIPEFPMYLVDETGVVISMQNGKWKHLARSRDRDGYLTVMLCNDAGYFRKKAHRIVMEVFKGKSKLHVNHIDGDKANNSLQNLEYCSAGLNNKHAYDSGLKSGSNNFKKLNPDQVATIRALKGSMSTADAAAASNISRTTVNSIWNNKIHKQG